jgi:RNase P subunit RPR2
VTPFICPDCNRSLTAAANQQLKAANDILYTLVVFCKTCNRNVTFTLNYALTLVSAEAKKE